MFARFAVILALVLQQVSFAAVVRPGTERGHEGMSCCQVVQATTCCGETVVEVVCSISQGPCECVAQSGPTRAPVPPAPVPARTDSAAAAIAAFLSDSKVAFSALTLRIPTWQPHVRRLGLRTHNQQLALLGVWRT